MEEGLLAVQGVQQAAGDLLSDMAESKAMQRDLAQRSRDLSFSLDQLHADERHHREAAMLAWQVRSHRLLVSDLQ